MSPPALAGADLAAVAARLAAVLRAAGVPVTPERAARFAAAVALAAPATVPELYWLARVTLVSEQSDLGAFAAVFDQVFGGVVDPAAFRGDAPTQTAPGESRRPDRRVPAARGPLPVAGTRAAGEPGGAGPGPEPGDDLSERDVPAATHSPDERLRHQDFATLTPDELARLRDLARDMALTPPARRARRRARDRTGSEIDVRATVRRARRTGGEPFVAQRRRRRDQPRRLVFVCDISGSMEPYARAYLQLLVSAVGGTRAEGFVFATRLTRVTRALRDSSPDAALARAGRLAPDWAGGTRIGDALRAFNDGYGRRGMARGAVVLILSDGWDTGDPAELGRQMARLGRLAYRVVWVNPRKQSPAYEPLAGGMAAALPHVDAFVSGHSHAAMDEVLAAIASR